MSKALTHKKLDKLWETEKVENGWTLPKISWYMKWKTLPVIRYVRWFVLNLRVQLRARAWARSGIGFGVPHGYDMWYLYAIYRGWA